jgi:hypothetical protein
MTEEEKQALRKSFAGKSVSQMTPDERKVFDVPSVQVGSDARKRQ